ncbi:hypothetical protein F5876DRAFT_54270, partial [Lentinula aff. lateritia]
ISDQDELFVSDFWRTLNKLTGVKIKMSSFFHPKMDRLSKSSNKTINQSVTKCPRRSD